MVWISLLFFILSSHAANLERFFTKHSAETLRYISMDGRYAYVQKKPGVLGLVTNFSVVDFLTDTSSNNFLVKSSRFKYRLAVESIPNYHDELSLVKNHKIYVMDYGNSVTREVGLGRNAKLHLRDEWITFYNMSDKKILIQNLVTQKKFEIKLSKKPNPFFIPEVEMISDRLLVFSDLNEQGYAALISYDLQTLKSNILIKSSQSATKLELCQNNGYLAIGEFPYEGLSRTSKIQTMNLSDSNLMGQTTIYSSVEQDPGNMICLSDSIYFIKTMNQDKILNFKTTEAVKLDVKSHNLVAKSNLKYVSQLIEMDGRVLIPFRSEFYVLEGKANLGVDTLQRAPKDEELQIDI